MKGGPVGDAFQALAESLARQIAIRNAQKPEMASA
jgi:hypothetical protein